MSEHKKNMNPWITAVILGVIGMLFAFFALQTQTELQESKKKVEQLERQLNDCVATAAEQQKRAEEAMRMAVMQEKLATNALHELELKQSKKK
jgi:septal ring-binding cell division protein DamX